MGEDIKIDLLTAGNGGCPQRVKQLLREVNNYLHLVPTLGMVVYPHTSSWKSSELIN
jgi:hypothetical protein